MYFKTRKTFLYSDVISVNNRQNACPEKLLYLMKFFRKVNVVNYTEKVLSVHFIRMQLNFSILSMFTFVAPQNAGFMGRRMQV